MQVECCNVCSDHLLSITCWEWFVSCSFPQSVLHSVLSLLPLHCLLFSESSGTGRTHIFLLVSSVSLMLFQFFLSTAFLFKTYFFLFVCLFLFCCMLLVFRSKITKLLVAIKQAISMHTGDVHSVTFSIGSVSSSTVQDVTDGCFLPLLFSMQC